MDKGLGFVDKYTAQQSKAVDKMAEWLSLSLHQRFPNDEPQMKPCTC